LQRIPSHHALEFLTTWSGGNLGEVKDYAADLVRTRYGALDGGRYEVLEPAAQQLEAKEPFAAVLLYRKMIEFILDRGRSSHYANAAIYLRRCETLAASIPDWQGELPHEAYVARLRQLHSRESDFAFPI
jgi:hypothetical protein